MQLPVIPRTTEGEEEPTSSSVLASGPAHRAPSCMDMENCVSVPASACAWRKAAAPLRDVGMACAGLGADRAASRVGLAGVPELGCSAACVSS